MVISSACLCFLVEYDLLSSLPSTFWICSYSKLLFEAIRRRIRNNCLGVHLCVGRSEANIARTWWSKRKIHNLDQLFGEYVWFNRFFAIHHRSGALNFLLNIPFIWHKSWHGKIRMIIRVSKMLTQNHLISQCNRNHDFIWKLLKGLAVRLINVRDQPENTCPLSLDEPEYEYVKIGHIFYCLSFFVSTLRVLTFFNLSRRLGPKIRMIVQEMIQKSSTLLQSGFVGWSSKD